MILNEREMQMAKELARELVRVEREKQRRQFEEVRDSFIDLWSTLKNTLMNAFNNDKGPKNVHPESLNITVPSIDFQKALDGMKKITEDICPHCGGSGRLGAMQLAIVMSGGTVRGLDTTTECNICNGTGRK